MLEEVVAVVFAVVGGEVYVGVVFVVVFVV